MNDLPHTNRIASETGTSLRTALRRLSRSGLFALEAKIAAEVREPPRTPRERAHAGSWFLENVCALHGIQVDVVGRFPDEPSVVVANHVSYVEPLAILAKTRGVAIAKHELRAWPVVGDAMRAVGTLFVDRSDPHSGARVLREAMRTLGDGVNVLVFPEGTTTRGQHVLPFRRGAFGLARATRTPIVPVAVTVDHPDVAWVDDDAFLPHYLRLTGRAATRVTLTVLPPIVPSQHDHDAAGLAALARRQIAAELTAA